MGKVFGTGYVVADVRKMQGGAQKVVYKIDCSNGFTCVMYVWDLTMNYFQEEIEQQDLNRRSYGADLFEMNNKYLTQQGIKTPALYDLNQERARYPFDYGLVEYIDGLKAEVYFDHSDPRVQDKVFQRVGDMVAGMHSNIRNTFGPFNTSEILTGNCHQGQVEKAISDLAYASLHIDNIGSHQSKLLDRLYELEAKIESRSRYGYIHGELGPDHILVNHDLEPYLIDIEGAEFYDIEYEHTFLELRFGNYYRYLKNDKLDPNRMLFYRYYHHISLTAGGLKLEHRGFYDQAFAMGLAAQHSKRALQFIGVN
ncbi:aminoglycoside phosphotransferase family protein [Paenibacillus psychroresistens]|uniref:Aminoglycoside phosphotransferase family protein n=1 Tax=Paenibacillus psychroresistens TaxID=1778678 RepID=A0A6B8RU88_9BACL|nr:aminoglycoside phosphotransferase family protein [Paenibacillus psychroresistens]QGR00111.1 aminoglycoside phosphotransferase family protein [Paenibacillus psychroresistens]